MTEYIGFGAKVSIPGPLWGECFWSWTWNWKERPICLQNHQVILPSSPPGCAGFKSRYIRIFKNIYIFLATLDISCPKCLPPPSFTTCLTFLDIWLGWLREPQKELPTARSLQPWVPREHPPAVRGKHLSHVDRGICWGHVQDWREEQRGPSPSWVATFFSGHCGSQITFLGPFRTWIHKLVLLPSSLHSLSLSLSPFHAGSHALQDT